MARKTARLEARITEQQKAMIERAAAYEGRSVTDFVVHAVAQAAKTVVQDHEVLRLNQAQSRAFVQRLAAGAARCGSACGGSLRHGAR